jgi:hypothetical protein
VHLEHLRDGRQVCGDGVVPGPVGLAWRISSVAKAVTV